MAACRWALALVLGAPTLAWAEVEPADSRTPPPAANRGFSTGFLKGGAQGNDLSAFLYGNNVVPGTYRVDIHINGELTGRRDVMFAPNAVTGTVEACITEQMLRDGGVDLKKVELDTRPNCLPLAELIEHSTIEYHPNRLQLLIGIPQAYLLRGTRGYISPQLWDEGVTAGFINYNLNLRRQASQDQSDTSSYLSMRNGINLGMWRLRNDSTLSSVNSQASRLTSNQTYAARDITALKSQLTVGETYESSDIFDSVRFRGFALRTDQGMRPDSERGYAPVIRGTAESNATVEVRQNGYLLSQTNVPPGPFELTDIRPSGSNGDLEITVIEADGRRRVSTQAFASLPRMVREGAYDYTLAVGQYSGHGNQSDVRPMLATGSLSYGWSSDATVYGGMQWSEKFRASSLGISRNTAIGAVSFDATQSNSEANQNVRDGQSYRLLYSKTLNYSGTTFTLASYRFSTDGYRTLADHVRDLEYDTDTQGRARSRFDLTINQSLGETGGTLYLTANQQRYWNRAGQSQQLQAGYSNLWGHLNYNLSLAHSKAANRDILQDDTRVTLTFSLPLGKGASHRITSTTNAHRNGDYTHQSGISGEMPDWDSAHYNLQAGHHSASGSTGSASISTQTSMANFDASHSIGHRYHSSSLGVGGSLVAHRGGLNLGQPVTETFALIDVQGAPEAQIANHAGIRTGANGFAVLPSVVPYRTNWVSLDTRHMGADVELESSSLQLIPRRGSITTAAFKAQSGHRVQFEIDLSDGTRMPFGAVVSDEEGNMLGVTDPSGRALVLVMKEGGTLSVKSGADECKFEYALGEKTAGTFYVTQRARCLP